MTLRVNTEDENPVEEPQILPRSELSYTEIMKQHPSSVKNLKFQENINPPNASSLVSHSHNFQMTIEGGTQDTSRT